MILLMILFNDFILVSRMDFKTIFDLKLQKFVTHTYVSYFVKKMVHYVSCTLKSDGPRVCKRTLTVRLLCMHSNCGRQYRLVCKRDMKIDNCFAFRIEHNNVKIHHTKKIVRQCRGIDRVLATQQLAKTTAEEFRQLQIANSNKDQLKSGNLQSVYSKEVIRKIRSEALRKHDLHDDAITGLGKKICEYMTQPLP